MRRVAAFITALALVITNAVVALYPSWPNHFILQIVGTNAMSLRPDEHAGGFVLESRDSAYAFPETGLPEPLEDRIQQKRIRHVVRAAIFEIQARRVAAENYQSYRTYAAKDIWKPIENAPFRFVFADELKLPPGDYEVRARLFARPPWGVDPLGRNLSRHQSRMIYSPAWPGSLILLESSSDPVTVHVPANDSAAPQH